MNKKTYLWIAAAAVVGIAYWWIKRNRAAAASTTARTDAAVAATPILATTYPVDLAATGGANPNSGGSYTNSVSLELPQG